MMLKQNIFKMDIKIRTYHLKVVCLTAFVSETIQKVSSFLSTYLLFLNCFFPYLKMLGLLLL